MSFAEKSAWSVLVSLALVYGWYATVIGGWASGSQSIGEVVYQPLLIAVTVPLVVLLVTFHVVIAILSPRTAGIEDERDRVFELRAA